MLRVMTLVGMVLSWLSWASCGDPNKALSRPQDGGTTNVSKNMTSFFELSANGLEGGTVNFSEYRGKKVVVLNVASKCGYTPQYADWEAFYKQHSDKVVVLGFPCNDFMMQEPGSAADIAEFCQRNYGVSFPMFEKIHVKGGNQSAVYQWLTDPAKNGWNKQEPTWNFCKYVVNEKGELVNFFASDIKPDDAGFRKAVGL